MLKSFRSGQDPFFPLPLFSPKTLLLFVDREKELQAAIQSLRLNRNLLITGMRGSGKTTFINALRQNITEKELIFIPVYISDSFKGITVHSLLCAIETELYAHLSANEFTVTDAIRRRHEFLSILSEASVSDLMMLIQKTMTELRNNKNNKIVLIFDDIDKTSFDLTLLATIRDQLWKLDVLFIFVSNRRQFEKIIDTAMEPFFFIIALSGLDRSQTEELIRKRLEIISNRQMESVMEPDTISLIYQLSEGNPGMILAICRYAFTISLNRGNEKITIQDISRYGIERIISTPMENDIIKILSNEPSGLSVTEIYQRLVQSDFKISRSRVSQILNKLISSGALKAYKSGRHNIYEALFLIRESLNEVPTPSRR